MVKQSAGILVYRFTENVLEVFLVHPGGPFWKNKDLGAWSIPKGEFAIEEKPLDAARREFKEETGIELSGEFMELKPVKLKSGKMVFAWALLSNIDAANVSCGSFVNIEWPPRSGKSISIPEIDKAKWFEAGVAKQKINSSQAALVDELIKKVMG